MDISDVSPLNSMHNLIATSPPIPRSTSGAYWIVLFFFMDETRGPVLLVRQARLLRKESGDNRYRARIEDVSPPFNFTCYYNLNVVPI